MSWNPNDPCILGLEWFPTVESSIALDSDNVAAAMTLHSATTESIEYVWVYVPSKRIADDGGWELEIYDAADIGGTSVTASTFKPGEDVRRIDAYGWGVHAPTGIEDPNNLWRAVDASGLTPGVWPNSGARTDHNEGIFPVYGSGFEVSFLYSGVQGALTGNRISCVTLVGVFNEYWWQDLPGGTTVRPYVTHEGKTAYGDAIRLTPGRLGTVTGRFWSCPSTKASWKIADLEKLDTGVVSSYENGAGWQVGATRSANNLPMMHRTYLSVEHVGTEKRVATGVLTHPVAGWNRIPVYAIDTTNPWAKASGTDYLVTLRRTASPHGSIAWRSLGNSEQPAVHVWSMSSVGLTDSARVPDPDAYVDDGTAVNYAILLQIDGSGDISVESQPYASGMGDLEPKLGSYADKTVVDASRTIQQDFTPSSTDDYGFIRLLGRLKTTTSDGSLTVKIKRRSDDVQMGGTMTVAYSDLSVPRDKWQVIEGQLSGAAPTLTNGTEYYFEIASTASASLGWQVQVLSTMQTITNPPPAGTPDATFGDLTSRAYFNATGDDSRDVSIVVHTVPDTPTGFAATGYSTCADPKVELVWDATNIVACSGFMQYELERSDDGSEWKRIGVITTENVTTFTDREARISRAQYYRMRVRRADHSCSDYTATETVTLDPGCCGYWFSSNESDSGSVWGDDIDPPRVTKLGNTHVVKPFYGRNYQVAFHELEWRGEQFTRKLIVAGPRLLDGIADTTTPGLRTFDPILDAVTPSRGATYSYVCVRSESGDRWFASVVVTELEERQPRGWYLATVEVVEVTDTPSTPDKA